jgi:hypothetical protein
VSDLATPTRRGNRWLVPGLSIAALTVILAWVVFVLPVMSIFTPDPDHMTQVLIVSVGPLALAGGLWLAAAALLAFPIPSRPWMRTQYLRSSLALALGVLGGGVLVYAVMWGRALSCKCGRACSLTCA